MSRVKIFGSDMAVGIYLVVCVTLSKNSNLIPLI